MMRPINKIVVHCSASRPSADIGVLEISEIHRLKGWDGCGYHYVIRLNGTIEPGRAEHRVGAHVQGHNVGSLGVCLIGGLNAAGKPANTFTAVQFASLGVILRSLQGRSPQARICGHRDLSPDRNRDGIISPDEWLKECPCFDVASWCRANGINPNETALQRATKPLSKPVLIGTTTGTAVGGYAAYEALQPTHSRIEVPLDPPALELDAPDVDVADMDPGPMVLDPVPSTYAETGVAVASAVHTGLSPLAYSGIGFMIALAVVGVIIVLLKARR